MRDSQYEHEYLPGARKQHGRARQIQPGGGVGDGRAWILPETVIYSEAAASAGLNRLAA